MTSISDNLKRIQTILQQQALKSGRDPASITLVAVSKTKPSSLIEEALQAGQADFGENYVQEWQGKSRELKDHPLRWHFIGHLQRRKARDLVGQVHLIHSLDSWELAVEIDKRASEKNSVQSCLLQVNPAQEATKSGLHLHEIPALLERLKSLPHVDIQGLMTLPPPQEEMEQSRPYFRELREMRDSVNAQRLYRHELKELSMGMSHDFPVAIEEGATLIRVGTAIFGER